MPSDCREQLRELGGSYWLPTEAENKPEGKKVKRIKLYKQSAIYSIFECGSTEQL